MNYIELDKELNSLAYHGRGIIIGKSPDGRKAVTAYFIMGRSENSRNRVFVEDGEGIRTQAFDPSKMVDPHLIIYAPVRVLGNKTIVTNGDQTDTIRDHILDGHCYRHALNTRAFEPDGPNFTPRISGVVKPDGNYNLSILKSLDGDPDCCCRYFFEYDHAAPGVGHFIHTYQEDVNPLPSFEGEPRRVAIPQASAHEWAQQLWASLNADNKVSLYVSMIDVHTGSRDSVIINKHG